jgi:hypothetical protein
MSKPPSDAKVTMTGDAEAIAAFVQAREETREREALWPKTAAGHVDTRAAMTRLVRLFPSLRDAMGVEPWDPDAFLAWACGAHSSGMLHAAKFILSVWNPATDWNAVAHEAGLLAGDERLSPFSLHDALGVWDYEHRDAFGLWVHAAFWP